MSVMSEIKSGNIREVYLFYGEEAYKKRLFKDLLKTKVIDGNMMNYSAFEGRNIDWQEVYDSVLTMPFFAQKRLIVVENSGKFKLNKDKTDSASEQGNDWLEKIINEAPETACVAFFEESAAKNKRVYKLIASKGVVCECNPDTEDTIINWLAKGFASHGKKIRRSTLNLLTERVGLNYDQLKSEVDKIVSYSGDAEVIEDADILAVSSETTESKIFELLDAISAKNISLVLKRYYELLENKEHPLYIMAMLRNQFRTMLQTCELKDSGLNAAEIAKETGKPQFVVRKNLGYLRSFQKDRMIKMLDDINETDRMSKRGMLTDQIGVEMLLIRFTG